VAVFRISAVFAFFRVIVCVIFPSTIDLRSPRLLSLKVFALIDCFFFLWFIGTLCEAEVSGRSWAITGPLFLFFGRGALVRTIFFRAAVSAVFVLFFFPCFLPGLLCIFFQVDRTQSRSSPPTTLHNDLDPPLVLCPFCTLRFWCTSLCPVFVVNVLCGRSHFIVPPPPWR